MKRRDLVRMGIPASRMFTPRDADAPYRIWGSNLEPDAVQQLKNACKLPVAVSGALMPDAHVGYGLPIGGVLATRDAVIPYAVGVDIACRMKMSVLDLPLDALDDQKPRLVQALEHETRFGIGATFRARRDHDVMDRDWRVTPITSKLKDRAWSQLGTSGSGNHFVEFGELTVLDDSVGLARGKYLALLSHSGSRGTGAQLAQHYSTLARDLHPELPKDLSHLAWLDLASEAGQEYWAAMELMGKYAAANHHLIHVAISKALGVGVMLDLENHHNFAWRERHVLPDGSEQELIVHRKGATPAGAGVLGIIPGSMGTPGYVVRGKGVAESVELRRARRRSTYEPHESEADVQLGDDTEVSARAWRDAALCGTRRSADGLQGHRGGHGGAARSRRTARTVRSAPGQDGP
jgi:tRNA-splicing ligase RtcB